MLLASKGARKSRMFAGVSAAVTAFLAVSVLSPMTAIAADADDPLAHVLVQLQKTITPDTVSPAVSGGQVSYTIGVNCSDLQTDCINLHIDDTVPDPLVLQSVTLASNGGGDPSAPTAQVVTTGNSFTATFTTNLGGGNQGLTAGASAELTVVAVVPANVSADYDGLSVVNTAYAKLDNINSNQQSSASIPLSIPTTLASTIDKTITPSTIAAVAGSVATITLDARNTANRAVDSLVVQDPAGSATLFDYAAVTAITAPAWPTGADLVQVDWYDGATWTTGTPQATIGMPSGASAAGIMGLRFTFTSTSGGIARDAQAIVSVATALRGNVSSIDPSATATNDASSYVTYGPSSSTPVVDAATLVINKVSVNPQATKLFSSDNVVGGDNTDVTLTATNAGDFVLKSMTITEPATGTPTLADQGLAFDSWVANSIEWPAGATAASVGFLYADDPTTFAIGVPAGARDTLPAPQSGRVVIGFTVTFTGTTMGVGQYATVPYAATTQAVTQDVTTTNTIGVDVITTGDLIASTSATDDLTRRTARIDTTVSKTMTPSTIYSVAGAYTIISLPARVDPMPTGPADPAHPVGSTIGATSLVVSDTVDPSTDPFWESFDAASVVSTDVPVGTTLTVEYWDGAGWVALDTGVPGPASYGRTFSAPERAAIRGLRFTYEPTSAATLPPGFNVQPNIRAVLRDTMRSDPATAASGLATDSSVANTVRSEVANAAASPSTVLADSAASLTMLAVGPGAGGIDMVSKVWNNATSTGTKAVNARSGDQVSSTVSWGTGGLAFDSVVISDTEAGPDGKPADVATTAFDAFDLVGIPAITASDDPLLRYDTVSGVEFFYTDAWHASATNPCAGTACDGAFPGYTLTAGERANATGVRLTFVESPTRSTRIAGNPLAPEVGSGVASSMTQSRHLTLLFELRDATRSTGAAVLGGSRHTIYNSSEGVVINTVGIVATAADSSTRIDSGSDSITILDKPINVIATKTWTDGPLGTPPPGTPQALYPTARLVISAQNASTIKVNELSLAEPITTPTPFEYVNLTKVVSITTPTGATGVVVTLAGLGTYTDITQVTALTATQLQDVTGITVDFRGRIAAGARTTVTMNTQLRIAERTSGADASARTIDNTVLAAVTDPSGTTQPASGTDNTVTATASAPMVVQAFSYGAVASKGIVADTTATASVPAIQYGASSDTAAITLSGRPTGNVRTTRMVIEDSAPTFWNAYSFDAFGTNSFTNPINRVQVDVLVGTTYQLDAGVLTAYCGPTTDLAACWIKGTAATSLALPGGTYTTADIRGIRFTYTKSDYSAWERPYNPEQFVHFTVQRRTNLTWAPGGVTPVPSTLYIYPDPAPGETQPATFTNDVTVTASAALDATDTAPLWSASATDSKQLKYQHQPARVEIAEQPYGALSLGSEIPYQLDVTNIGANGEKPLTGVVTTYEIPGDASGPLLVIPTDQDTGAPITNAEAFTYTLRNAAGVAQVAPAVVASVGTGSTAGQVLTFTMPAGSSIPLGWELSIQLRLQFRPLLEAGTLVTTGATVVSDQEFDTCSAYRDNGVARPTLTDQSSCSTMTTVWPLASAPMTITKGVRGVDAGALDATGTPLTDDLGVLKTQPTNPTDCTAPNMTVNGSGFYRYPCVPITRPGGVEEWVAKFSNSGNVSVGKVVAIDLLPTKNDTGVIIPDARGSKFTPKLSGFPQLSGVADGDLAVYYLSTPGVATPRCNGADIQNEMGMTAASVPPITAPACLTDTAAGDDVPDRHWTQLLPSDDLASLTIVALKFIVTTPTGIAPGASMAITYRSTTPANVDIVEADANLGRDSVAYNSIAGAAVGINQDTNALDVAYRFVTEPRKVGVALATGQMRLLKTVDGSALSTFKPTSFAINLSCTSAGQPITLKNSADAPRSPFLVTAGTELLVKGIPLYASCVVSEDTDYGQTASTITPTAVVAQAAQAANPGSEVTNEHPAFASRPAIELSTVTNTYSAATLVVTKTVTTGGALNQAGTAITYKAASFTVVCTFDKGSGASTIYTSGTFTLGDGATKTITGLVAGAACVVTETNAQGAASTSYVVTQDGGAVASAATKTTTVTLVADTTPNPANNTVAFTNAYSIGGLTVRKVVDGDARDSWGNQTFTLHVTCTNTRTSTATVWDQDIVVTKTGTTQIADELVSTTIPAGSSCLVTEAAGNDGGATSTSIPTTATTVTAGGNPVITATNTFTNSSLTITKQVQTSAVDQANDPVYPAVTFDFSVGCTWEGTTVLAPQAFTLARLGTRTFSGLPSGSSCTVTETSAGGADSTTIATTTAAGTASTNATTATIASLTTGANSATVTNRYGVASFTVTKAAMGGAAAQFGTGPFTIHVTCTARTGVTAFDDDIVLGVGGVWDSTIDNLATGSACTAVESDMVGADSQSTVFDVDDAVAGNVVTVTTGNPGHATIRNWYLTGSLVVTKSVTGAAAGFGVGPFSVALECTRAGQSITIPGGDVRALSPGSMTTTYTGLPSGADCVLSEPDSAGAASSFIATDVAHPLTTDVAAGQHFTVTVDPAQHTDDQAQPAMFIVNDYEPAGLVISKVVTSAAVDQDGAPVSYGPFPVAVDCTFEGAPVYAAGYSATTPMQASLVPGTDWSLGGLVSGAACVVTETPKDAVNPSIDTVVAGTGHHVPGTSATLVLAPNSGPTVRNTVSIDNPYLSGTIAISKAVAGAGTAWATETFQVDVVCTLTDGSGSREVWNESYDLVAGAAATLLEGVAAGADCTATESKTGGATSTSMTVDRGVPVDGTSTSFTSPAGATLPVVVTNTFDLASVDVTKHFTGAGATLWGAGPFEVSLACTRPVDGANPAITIPGGTTRTLRAPTWTASFDGLPINADCVATETKTGGANGSTVSPSTGFPLLTANTAVTLSNDFTEGEVAVQKTITGLGTPLYGAGPFEVTLECSRVVDGQSVDIAIPGGAARELNSGNGYAALYQHLPTAAECTATETKTAGATDSSAPVDLTIGDGTTENVAFTNTFDLGALTVTNIVTGNNWEPNSKWTFVIDLSCTLDMDGVPTDIPIPGGAERDILHLGTVDYIDLPIGAVCSLAETETNNADEVTVSPVSPAPGAGGRSIAPHYSLTTLAIGAAPVRFDVVNVYNITLAYTGTDSLPVGLAGLLIGFIGVALIAGSRLRRLREEN
ncbi:MAG: hypothetical protein JWP19_16 [Rhodoglobus sp.]|nr:hypothetical protein [Rhodoglobus sp.]